jgi:four helix bundle protein
MMSNSEPGRIGQPTTKTTWRQPKTHCDREPKSLHTPNHPALCLIAEVSRSADFREAVIASGISVGAHYREATQARSSGKVELGLQELEETAYWLELLPESGIIAENRFEDLLRETRELNAMLTASAKTAKRRR